MKPHIKLQHEIKSQSEETISSFQDLHSWQKEMKEKEKARLKGGQSENSKIPAVRSNTTQNNSNNHLPDNKETVNSSTEIKNNEKAMKTENLKEAQEMSSSCSVNPGCSENSSTNLSKQNEGDLCKDKGNELVKLGKHDEALYFYTSAINHFDKEPIYFANRALCYLKLEKFEECIKDCDAAINLDKTNVKAHYRRMQAYESLGQNEEALKSCETVLKLHAKFIEAKKSHQRILNRIKKTESIKESKPVFTNSNESESINEIEMYNKPPHLRSKKLLKKIKVKEMIGGKPSEVHISDEILDKLFTNNNIGTYEEIKKSNKIQDKASIHDINMDNNNKIDEEKLVEKKDISTDPDDSNKVDDLLLSQTKDFKDLDEDNYLKSFKNKNENINKFISQNQNVSPRNQMVSASNQNTTIETENLLIPTTPTQFYSIWKELAEHQRYIYLKMIPIKNLNKVLGAGLEPDTLTDIFGVLNEYYLKDNMEIMHILKEITKHDEFKILSMFLSKDDRELMQKFLRYMKERNNNSNDIEYIEDMYYLKE